MYELYIHLEHTFFFGKVRKKEKESQKGKEGIKVEKTIHEKCKEREEKNQKVSKFPFYVKNFIFVLPCLTVA